MDRIRAKRMRGSVTMTTTTTKHFKWKKLRSKKNYNRAGTQQQRQPQQHLWGGGGERWGHNLILRKFVAR